MSTQTGEGATRTAAASRGGGGGLLTNKKFRAIVSQVVVVSLLVAFVWFIVHNTAVNLEKRGIASGFGFLNNPAGFDVAFSLIDYSPQSTHGRVYVVGALNTILVAFVGCITATIIGFIMGVLRLSHNWVVSRLAYCYVEGLRNIPLLLQIIFWWSVFLLSLIHI